MYSCETNYSISIHCLSLFRLSPFITKPNETNDKIKFLFLPETHYSISIQTCCFLSLTHIISSCCLLIFILKHTLTCTNIHTISHYLFHSFWTRTLSSGCLTIFLYTLSLSLSISLSRLWIKGGSPRNCFLAFKHSIFSLIHTPSCILGIPSAAALPLAHHSERMSSFCNDAFYGMENALVETTKFWRKS